MAKRSGAKDYVVFLRKLPPKFVSGRSSGGWALLVQNVGFSNVFLDFSGVPSESPPIRSAPG